MSNTRCRGRWRGRYIVSVYTAQSTASSIILACTETETHTLSLEALRAALAERGRPAVMLGADVPVAALIDALERRAAAGTVMLWAQTRRTADRAVVAAAGTPGKGDPWRSRLGLVAHPEAGGACREPTRRGATPGHTSSTPTHRVTHQSCIARVQMDRAQASR